MQHKVKMSVGKFHLSSVYVFTGVQVVLALLAVMGVFLNAATLRWYRLCVVAAVAITTINVLSVAASPAIHTATNRLLQVIFEGRIRSRGVIVGLLLISLLCIASLFSSPFASDVLPSLWSFLPFVLFWPLVTLWLIMTTTDPAKHSARRFFTNTLVFCVSFIVFAALLEGALQLMFPRLPSVITSRMPQAALYTGIRYATPYGVRQYPPHQQVSFVVDERFGDLAAPYCPFPVGAKAEPPYRVQFVRDDYGFRNSTNWPDQPDLVVIGDSFVDAENVQEPFWAGITPATIGLGIQGVGNTEESLVLKEFGIPRKPQVVVMAYFEGNDLLDNVRFEEARQAGVTIYDYLTRQTPRLQFLVTYNLFQWLSAPLRPDACPEAVTVAQGFPMVTGYEYLSILTVDKKELLTSKAFQLTQKAILDAEALARSNGSTFVLAYIPVKAHAYWDSLIDANQLSRMGKIASPLILSPSLEYYDAGATDEKTAELLAQNHDDQRQVITELAEQNGIPFLDFTPYFQRAAAEGEALYFYGDSHWNQRGNDLANRVLGEFLRTQGLVPGSASG